jgi:RHS repeat-associated protein
LGTHIFTYDKVSRLTAANLYLEPTASTTLRTQTFGYDAFGNLLTFAGSSARNTPTAPGTNHLTGATYDASGNVIAWNGNAYTYDPFHLMWDYKTPTDEWIYLYTADDERAWSYKTDNTSLWTLRGLDAKVLREYTTNGTWSVAEDYIYRDGLLLAAETPAGTRHFHLDHLGTPRLVSNNLGQQAAYHVYYPFGEEATAFNQDTIRAKFTGHERDLGNPSGAGDDLDYMHARHESEWTGRFLSVDTAPGKLSQPLSWNRYSYVGNNPLLYLDPNGLTAVKVWEIGRYLIKLYPGDTFHGGLHYHIFLRNAPKTTIARIGLEGEAVTGKVASSLVKQMVKRGLITVAAVGVTGIMMFFDAAPANAEDDRLKMAGIAEDAIAPLTQKLFGTEDTKELTAEQFTRLMKEWVKQQDAEKKRKKDEANANYSLDALSKGGTFFHG